MKPRLFSAIAALGLTLLVTSCESTGGIPARAQEKSATYAALKPWEKRYIDTGSITEGFTSDMVYISMGKPDRIEPKDPPGSQTELWTYNRFYQRADAVHGLSHAKVLTDSDYAPPRGYKATTSNGGTGPAPVPTARGSINSNAGVQGGSMEPADPSSYTVKVLFKNGKVSRISAQPNL